MTFPRASLNAQLMPDEYSRLVKLLELHYAYPLRYPLAGAYFEEIFAQAVGGVREQRKLLFDVLQGSAGWSLKTLLWNRVERGAAFEVVIERCDILQNSDLSLAATSLPALGAAILGHFNTFCEKSAATQKVTDPRAGFLIRNRTEREFVFFQARFRLYQVAELSWTWGSDGQRSVIGSIHGQKVLRWYRSGTQLFGIYQIPEDAHSFEINCRRASLEETIIFFERAGIASATGT